MKIILILLFLYLISSYSSGQTTHAIVDENGHPVHYGVSSLNSKIPIFLETDTNTKSISPFNPITNDPLGSIVFLENASKILLTTRLKKDSVGYYRYTIVENDTNTIASNALLTKINFIWNNRSSWPGYVTMDFGVYDIRNKKLTVKIYKLQDAGQVTTLIIYNKPLQPAKIVEKVLVKEGRLREDTNSHRPDLITLKNKTEFRVDEKNKGIYVSMQKTDLDFAYFIYLVYQDKEGESPSLYTNNWNYGSIGGIPYYFIDANYFKRPGEYELIISTRSSYLDTIKAGENTATKFSFNVLAPPKTYSARDLIAIGLAACILISIAAACIIYVVSRNSRNKLIGANLQAEAARSELNTVRSQLNPHFVFNALSGIQNLMNKNDIESANGYLSKFARLTRNILDENSLISIKDEVELLEDYLSMEKLRFSFSYDIQVDESLNFFHTEIPAMLLQPFVENAVKHGMALLKTKGRVVIKFVKDDKDLVLLINDNGKGFEVSGEGKGLGLKLSKKRIALLNKMYTECSIVLSIASSPSNTTVKITLAQWL